jgi:hypothetical protein
MDGDVGACVWWMASAMSTPYQTTNKRIRFLPLSLRSTPWPLEPSPPPQE